MFRSILVAVDGSTHSERALEEATRGANQSPAAVLIVHAEDPVTNRG